MKIIELKNYIGNAKGSILKEFADFFGTSGQRLLILADRGVLVRDHGLFVQVRSDCVEQNITDGVYLKDVGRVCDLAESLGVKRQQIEQWIEKDAFFYCGFVFISMALNNKKKAPNVDFDLPYMKLELKKLQRDLSKQDSASLKRYLVRLSEAV